MSNKFDPKILDKVLSDLNLSKEQVIEEGLMDGIKNLAYKAGNALSNAAVPSPSNAASRVAGAMAPPGANLRDATVNTMGVLKNTAQKFEAEAAKQPTIDSQQAGGMYKQFNDQLLIGMRQAQAITGKAPQPGVSGATGIAGMTGAGVSGATGPAEYSQKDLGGNLAPVKMDPITGKIIPAINPNIPAGTPINANPLAGIKVKNAAGQWVDTTSTGYDPTQGGFTNKNNNALLPHTPPPVAAPANGVTNPVQAPVGVSGATGIVHQANDRAANIAKSIASQNASYLDANGQPLTQLGREHAGAMVNHDGGQYQWTGNQWRGQHPTTGKFSVPVGKTTNPDLHNALNGAMQTQPPMPAPGVDPAAVATTAAAVGKRKAPDAKVQQAPAVAQPSREDIMKQLQSEQAAPAEAVPVVPKKSRKKIVKGAEVPQPPAST